MTAAWASVLTGAAALAGVAAGRLWGGGRREGRIDAILEHITEILDDHEDRIRIAEGRAARQHRR